MLQNIYVFKNAVLLIFFLSNYKKYHGFHNNMKQHKYF